MTRHILQKLNWSVALPRAFVTLIYGVSTFEFISGRFLESKLYMGGNLDAGDWLINYHGGFFKRGLFGQIFLGVFHLHGALANWDLFVFQCVLYFVILSYFISYVRKNNFSTSSIILTCNPAAIAFVGWNHGITRKELLGFVRFWWCSLFCFVHSTFCCWARSMWYSMGSVWRMFRGTMFKPTHCSLLFSSLNKL